MFKDSTYFIQFIFSNHLVFEFYASSNNILFIFICDCIKNSLRLNRIAVIEDFDAHKIHFTPHRNNTVISSEYWEIEVFL